MISMKTNSFFTISAPEMRAINRSVILEFIRYHGPVSRSKIADELLVSLPTVMRIVDGLIADGFVKETGNKEWSGGRKRGLVIFNGSEHLIIGIDLGGTKVYGALADLDGKIHYETHFDHHQTHAAESFQMVCRLVDELIKKADQENMAVRGIGIGVPGITDPETGIVSLAPALEWQNFPLKTRLQERYSQPIVIENDVNLAALGEVWFGLENTPRKNLVLIAIGTGIGAGIIVNGSIYSGRTIWQGRLVTWYWIEGNWVNNIRVLVLSNKLPREAGLLKERTRSYQPNPLHKAMKTLQRKKYSLQPVGMRHGWMELFRIRSITWHKPSLQLF